jgi:hypothetical protein
MDNLQTQQMQYSDGVLNDYFLNAKALFLHHFGMLPSVSYISPIDGEKAFHALKEKYASLVAGTYRYRRYQAKRKKYEFDETILLLNNRCLLEFDNDYCYILHDNAEETFIDEITAFINQFKQPQRRQPLEINLIVRDEGELRLKTMEIKRTKLDLDLFYEDDFRSIDETIRKRLNKQKDKGIVLLHGLPGTGKTTYLRHLIGKIRKRVLFLSPNVAGDLMNPGFIDLLIDNPNSVVIVEDAENIIRDRRLHSGSEVSNLLNISDGLLADFLNVQLICTFNSPLTMVDEALMRKGRLIAKYEFGRLSPYKAQRLSDHLGFNRIIKRPMTVAEISNQNELHFEPKQRELIGFKQHFLIQ